MQMWSGKKRPQLEHQSQSYANYYDTWTQKEQDLTHKSQCKQCKNDFCIIFKIHNFVAALFTTDLEYSFNEGILFFPVAKILHC